MLRDNQYFILILSSLTLIVSCVLLLQSGIVMLTMFRALTGIILPTIAVVLGTGQTAFFLFTFTRLTRCDIEKPHPSLCCNTFLPSVFFFLLMGGYFASCIWANSAINHGLQFSSEFILVSDVHSIQRHFKCCGDVTPYVWKYHFSDGIMPDSCCQQTYQDCGKRALSENNLHKIGCRKFFKQQKECLIILILIASAVILFQAIFILIGYLYSKKK